MTVGFSMNFSEPPIPHASVLHSLCFRAYAGAWLPVALTLQRVQLSWFFSPMLGDENDSHASRTDATQTTQIQASECEVPQEKRTFCRDRNAVFGGSP